MTRLLVSKSPDRPPPKYLADDAVSVKAIPGHSRIIQPHKSHRLVPSMRQPYHVQTSSVHPTSSVVRPTTEAKRNTQIIQQHCPSSSLFNATDCLKSVYDHRDKHQRMSSERSSRSRTRRMPPKKRSRPLATQKLLSEAAHMRLNEGEGSSQHPQLRVRRESERQHDTTDISSNGLDESIQEPEQRHPSPYAEQSTTFATGSWKNSKLSCTERRDFKPSLARSNSLVATPSFVPSTFLSSLQLPKDVAGDSIHRKEKDERSDQILEETDRTLATNLSHHGQDVANDKLKQQKAVSSSLPSSEHIRTGSREAQKRGKQACSHINGKGLWNSWTRNFKTPLLALLDLIDNAVDAALCQDFAGSIDIELAKSFTLDKEHCGISITNNCFQPVRPLRDVLSVYKSAKGETEESIGENGVGLKQGCATLSDISFVLTRNNEKLSFGVIAGRLQEDKGCVLPAFEFNVKNVSHASFSEKEQAIEKELSTIAASDDGVAACICEFGRGDLCAGISGLSKQFSSLLRGKWGDCPYTFRVLLADLKHDASSSENASRSHGTDRACQLMQDLAADLPQKYLHIPTHFDFRVNGSPIQFSYWQSRLVEISKFSVNVDTKRLLFDYNKDDATWKTEGYPLRVYAGFDPLRLKDDTKDSSCSLYVYSRASGRLITSIADARNVLDLASSGTQYAQGLTIIVDDYRGHLPLSPTKQDISFGKQRNGSVHESNLYSWIGAVTNTYWNFHAFKYGKLKSLLSSEVQKHHEDVAREVLQKGCSEVPALAEADFSEFTKISWKLIRKSKTKTHPRLSRGGLVHRVGKATRYRLDANDHGAAMELMSLRGGKRKRSESIFRDRSAASGADVLEARSAPSGATTTTARMIEASCSSGDESSPGEEEDDACENQDLRSRRLHDGKTQRCNESPVECIDDGPGDVRNHKAKCSMGRDRTDHQRDRHDIAISGGDTIAAARRRSKFTQLRDEHMGGPKCHTFGLTSLSHGGDEQKRAGTVENDPASKDDRIRMLERALRAARMREKELEARVTNMMDSENNKLEGSMSDRADGVSRGIEEKLAQRDEMIKELSGVVEDLRQALSEQERKVKFCHAVVEPLASYLANDDEPRVGGASMNMPSVNKCE